MSQLSAAKLRLLMEQGLERGYFPKTAKSMFIADNSKEKEEGNGEIERYGLNLNYLDGGRYLGVYLGPWEELE